jgi:hypothetical protein
MRLACIVITIARVTGWTNWWPYSRPIDRLPPLNVWIARGELARRDEKNLMMNQTNGWMGGWAGGGMWIWTVIGAAVVVLLVIVIGKLSKK